VASGAPGSLKTTLDTPSKKGLSAMKLVFSIMAGLTVVLAAAGVRAGSLNYELDFVSGNNGAKYDSGSRTVTVDPGQGYVVMDLYASILGTNAIQDDDGYNGGVVLFQSMAVSGSEKLHGDFGPQLPPKNGTAKVPTPSQPYMSVVKTDTTSASNLGFAGEGSYFGAANDLNGDGDLDWGATGTAASPDMFLPSAGKSLADGDVVMGTDGTLVNGRTRIKMATIYWNYGGYHYTATSKGGTTVATYSFDSTAAPAVNGQAAAIHAYSLPTSVVNTYLVADGVNQLLAGNSSQITPNSAEFNKAYDIIIMTPVGPVAPEPATLALALTGGLAMAFHGWRRWRRKAA
jgi:hypothetical protein